MKKVLQVIRCKGAVALLSACCVVGLAGCASDGMALNTMGNNRVDRSFIEGYVTKQQKVIIDERETAVLTGVGVGAVGGAVVGGVANGGKGAVTGGILGAVAGGITGAVMGKEIEAYQTTITADNGQTYQGYLQQRLNIDTRVEFTVVDGKLKNVNVIPKPANKVTVIQNDSKKIAQPRVLNDEQSITGIITKREKIEDKWFYVVRDDKTKQNLIMEADQNYPYLRDRVTLSFQGENTITGMKLVEREAINEIQPKQAPKAQPKASAPVTQDQPKEAKADVVEAPKEVKAVETKAAEAPKVEEPKAADTKKDIW